MSDACEWVGYCIDEGIGDLQRAAGTLGALDELSMAYDADELRRMVRDSEVGSLGVIVGMTSDGVSDVNLAAAIARDGRARVVALVRRGASGSLRSRARNAGIDLVLDPTGEECREAEPPSALPSSPLSVDPRSLLGPLEPRSRDSPLLGPWRCRKDDHRRGDGLRGCPMGHEGGGRRPRPLLRKPALVLWHEAGH